MTKYPVTGLTGVTPAHLSWLAGQWKGRHGEDVVEEHWSDVGGNTLIGMFRWLRDDKVWFYEFMVIEQNDERLFLRLKHYYPGLKGWEEKDEATEFLLVQLQPQEAVFLQVNKPNAPWLIYCLQASNKLISYFAKEDKTPEESDKFIFSR